MEYLDLDKLKVEQTADFVHVPNCVINIFNADLDMPLSQFRAKLTDGLQPLFANLEDDVPTIFNIKLNCEDIPYDDGEILVEDFVSFGQQIISIIFNHLIDTENKRDRESRLDVPVSLKEQVYMPLNWLKNAINYQTKINKFNIIVRGYFQNETYLKFGLVHEDPNNSAEGIEICEH